MSCFARIWLYLNTLRYLKPAQVSWRVWRLLAHSPKPKLTLAPPLRKPGLALMLFPRKRRSMIAAGTFKFLNEEHRLAGAEDWNNPGWEALWLYNLHYFDDLCAGGTAPSFRILARLKSGGRQS